MPQPRKHASPAQRQAAYHQRRENARREQLNSKGLQATPALPTIPGTARWNQAIANAAELLAMVVDEMQQYHDDRSEAWQESDKAERFLERLEAIREVHDTVTELSTA